MEILNFYQIAAKTRNDLLCNPYLLIAHLLLLACVQKVSWLLLRPPTWWRVSLFFETWNLKDISMNYNKSVALALETFHRNMMPPLQDIQVCPNRFDLVDANDSSDLEYLQNFFPPRVTAIRRSSCAKGQKSRLLRHANDCERYAWRCSNAEGVDHSQILVLT